MKRRLYFHSIRNRNLITISFGYKFYDILSITHRFLKSIQHPANIEKFITL